jgi:hypothetical protein
MKKLYFIVLSIYFMNVSSLHAFDMQEVHDFSKEWAIKAVATLNHEECCLLANLLYFDFKSSYYDLHTRAHLHALREGLPRIQEMVDSYKQAQDFLLEFATYTNYLKEQLLPQHEISFKTWYACSEYMQQYESAALQEIADELADYVKNVIRSILAKHRSDLQLSYKIFFKNLKALAAEYNYSAAFLNGLSNGDNPLDVDAQDCDVADLDIALSVSERILKKNNEFLNPIYDLKRMTVALLELNTNIFAAFYDAFYQELIKKNPESLALIFDEHGITPDQHMKLPELADLIY